MEAMSRARIGLSVPPRLPPADFPAYALIRCPVVSGNRRNGQHVGGPDCYRPA
jgi:hypothetical protein